jgi:hypothetical protein
MEPAGYYKATLILTTEGEKKTLLDDIVHFITIHTDGTITEDKFISPFGAKRFTPERVWHKSILAEYELERIY